MKHICERKLQLETLKEEILKKSMNFPEGKLRIYNQKGIPRYYHIMHAKDTRGKYINHQNRDLAYQLAQKDYLQKLNMAIHLELNFLDEVAKRNNIILPESIYENLNPYRQQLVTPIMLSDKMFTKEWKEEAFLTNPHYPEEKIYVTRNEEFVRSKSEVLIADLYKELEIPYRYEAELVLKDGKKKYPDFTLLKVKTREIIYHEHLGLLDKEEYRLSNMTKFHDYFQNGIYIGKNLIVTWEATGFPINMKQVRNMLTEVFEL